MKRLISVLLVGIFIGFLLGLPAKKDAAETSLTAPQRALIPIARLPDGALYEGAIKDGMLHGQGTLAWPNGDRYEGGFEQGLFQGQGFWQEFEGDSYRGSFKAGLFHGQGVYKTASGDIYTGEFASDTFTGAGIQSMAGGGSYVGSFKDWEFSGEGTYTTASGELYKGTFDKGSPLSGQFLGVDGEQYEGGFEYWLYKGQGRLKTAAGDVYQGEFSNGQYHGKGALTYAKAQDGVEQINGEWRWGQLIKSVQGGVVSAPEEMVETVLYNQQDLLASSWSELQHNNPEEIDLYFLGVGGYGSQAVFRREVSAIREYFDVNYDTAGKSMVLLNSRRTIEDSALATTTSIRRSLQAMTAKMDAEQDILFFYLSSHGSRDFVLSLEQPGVSLPDLPAAALGEIFKELPVRWKVIVISACYAGGFIPELADEYTLVLTAAAKDKRSFGCSDGNEFTYFGEAFFKDALPNAESFASAFDQAVAIITAREKSEGRIPSEPQMHQPDAISAQLARWREQRAGD